MCGNYGLKHCLDKSAGLNQLSKWPWTNLQLLDCTW